jgi:hypothetical protein
MARGAGANDRSTHNEYGMSSSRERAGSDTREARCSARDIGDVINVHGRHTVDSFPVMERVFAAIRSNPLV